MSDVIYKCKVCSLYAFRSSNLCSFCSGEMAVVLRPLIVEDGSEFDGSEFELLSNQLLAEEEIARDADKEYWRQVEEDEKSEEDKYWNKIEIDDDVPF